MIDHGFRFTKEMAEKIEDLIPDNKDELSLFHKILMAGFPSFEESKQVEKKDDMIVIISRNQILADIDKESKNNLKSLLRIYEGLNFFIGEYKPTKKNKFFQDPKEDIYKAKNIIIKGLTELEKNYKNPETYSRELEKLLKNVTGILNNYKKSKLASIQELLQFCFPDKDIKLSKQPSKGPS